MVNGTFLILKNTIVIRSDPIKTREITKLTSDSSFFQKVIGYKNEINKKEHKKYVKIPYGHFLRKEIDLEEYPELDLRADNNRVR